jgi:hypothetical protein
MPFNKFALAVFPKVAGKNQYSGAALCLRCPTPLTISVPMRSEPFARLARCLAEGRSTCMIVVARVYHLLTKEAAYGPNLHHLDEFRAAQKLEKSLD